MIHPAHIRPQSTVDDVRLSTPPASLHHVDKKTLPTMGLPTECHMDALFKPKTFDQKCAVLSRPNITDSHLLSPAQFKKIGDETRHILNALDNTSDALLALLNSHDDNHILLNTYRHLLVQV